MPGGCPLTLRANLASLPAAASVVAPGTLTLVLDAQAAGNGPADWRIVELWSAEGFPWTAQVEWNGGNGPYRLAEVSVSQATRICVCASNVRVSGSSLRIGATQQVWATIADAYADLQNQRTWYVVGAGPLTPQMLGKPPPFSTFVRVDCADQSQLGNIVIELLDSTSGLLVRHTGLTQPAGGIPVGDTANLQVTAPAALLYRVTWLLQI